MVNRVREKVARWLSWRLGGVTDHLKGTIRARKSSVSNTTRSTVEMRSGWSNIDRNRDFQEIRDVESAGGFASGQRS
jgi:hypothetical protein